MTTKRLYSSILLSFISLTSFLLAQTPTGLTVKAATSTKVDLTWTGTASTYTIQRRVLGGTYANVGTSSTAAFSDTVTDPYNAFQYQIVAGTSAASNAVTVGPPPSGFTNAAPRNTTGDGSQLYGVNLSSVLDGNGDPAFAFIFADPNDDLDLSDSQLLFRSWNRAQYQWNSPITLLTVGNRVSSNTQTSVSLGYDASTKTFAVITRIQDGPAALFVSSDLGATWTRKVTFDYGAGLGVTAASLALGGGNIYLAMVLESDGLRYVTGKLSDASTAWTTQKQPAFPGGGVARSQKTPSVALDSSGAPAVAYWANFTAANTTMNLLYWRPNGSATPVKITDNFDGFDDDFAHVVKLAFFGSNPRALIYVAKGANYGMGIYTASSSNGGATWAAPVVLPALPNTTTDYPADIAVDSQGRGAVAFGQNHGTGDTDCGYPRVSRSNDFVTWKTCDVANNVQATQNFVGFPQGLQIAFAGNDKLYLFWTQADGIQMYREPPANASATPSVSAVVQGATFQTGIVAGSWTSIFGANFGDVTRTWDGDIIGTVLPLNLNGTSVKMNGIDAAVAFISPTQLNVQAPAGINGNVTVTVTRNGAVSSTFTTTAVASAPGLFTYAIGGKTYAAALFNGTATLVGDPASNGQALKAKPGDIIQLYATGLGASPSGNLITSPIVFTGTMSISLGTTKVTPLFTGLVGVGLFQINFTVPALADGDYPLTITAQGVTSPSGIVFPVKN